MKLACQIIAVLLIFIIMIPFSILGFFCAIIIGGFKMGLEWFTELSDFFTKEFNA